MAPKRPAPMEVPPAEETSSEGEEENEIEGESSSSEEEATQKQSQKLSSQIPRKEIQIQKPAAKKPEPPSIRKPESESESGSSESESDSDDAGPVKPIASKPMEETPTTRKPRSKPSLAAAAKSTAGGKRGSETGQLEQKEAKRVKAEQVGGRSEESRKLFQRVWSLEDEVVVLKGHIDFVEKTGNDPSKDMSGFYEFVKDSLQCDVNMSQVRDKVWTIKRRFAKHVEKSKKGMKMTFTKPHDQEVFELWKKIWGGESGAKVNGSAKKGNENSGSRRGNISKSLASIRMELGLDSEAEGKKRGEKVDQVEKNCVVKRALKFVNSLGGSGIEEFVMKRGLDMLECAKRAELEEKWRKLQLEELQHYLKRNALLKEQSELMLAVLRAEDD